MDDWTTQLDSGGQINVIYTDFAKAFDTVPLQRLLFKIKDIKYKHRLIVSKSPSPDLMHPHFLKNCADLIRKPLMYIFQEERSRCRGCQ